MGEYGRALDYWADFFEREIQKSFGDEVSIKSEAKGVNRLGRSEEGTTTITTVQVGGGNETFLTDNLITKLTSSVASTTTIYVQGHTIDADGNFAFVEQTVTLNGTADVPLATPLARAWLMINTGATALTGQVAARTAANVIYAEILAGQQRSFKGGLTVANDEYLAVKQVMVGVVEKTAASAEFQLEIRDKGGVFRPEDLLVASSPGSGFVQVFQPWFIVPPNADVRVRCIATGVSTSVAASIEGVFARKLGES